MLAVAGLSHLGDLMFLPRTLHQMWCMSRRVAHSCGLLNHPNSFRGGMFKLNTECDADSLLYSLSHFKWNSHTEHMLTHGIYRPHWLVQWSCHCSHMRIPVHSPWLPGYIHVMQTILIILTMAGLFQDRPFIYVCVCVYTHTHIKNVITKTYSGAEWLCTLTVTNLLGGWLPQPIPVSARGCGPEPHQHTALSAFQPMMIR